MDLAADPHSRSPQHHHHELDTSTANKSCYRNFVPPVLPRQSAISGLLGIWTYGLYPFTHGEGATVRTRYCGKLPAARLEKITLTGVREGGKGVQQSFHRY